MVPSIINATGSGKPMPDFTRAAAAINLRVRQLKADGVRGLDLANRMLGHMAELDRIYRTTSDDELAALCNRFPAFARYARLMEEVSAKNDAMTATGTHPYADMPRLPEPLAGMLADLLRDAAEIERQHRSAADTGTLDRTRTERLAAMRGRWASELERVVGAFRASDVPAQGQAWVQDVLRATAERIVRLD